MSDPNDNDASSIGYSAFIYMFITISAIMLFVYYNISHISSASRHYKESRRLYRKRR